jgi:CrcB protein
MWRFVLVVIAGGVGSGARYGIALWSGEAAGEFPRATLIVNVVGSFLIALVLETATRKTWSTEASLALSTGFLGGFTTYSAFNYQTTSLALDGHTAKAAVNIGATLIGCIVAGLVGIWLARRFA